MSEGGQQVFTLAVEVFHELIVDLQDMARMCLEITRLDGLLLRAHQEVLLYFSPLRQFGRHRSIVRLVASHLPLKPCRRPYFRSVAAEKRMLQVHMEWESQLETPKRPEKEAVEEELKSFTGWSADIVEPDIIVSSHRNSTPKTGGQHSFSDNSVASHSMVQDVLDQLHLLRLQVDRILESQQTSDYVRSSILSRCGFMSPKQYSPQPPPPPPPPPPLPPPPGGRGALLPSSKKLSLTEQIALQSNRLSPREDVPDHPKQVTMSDVLKDIGSVKLRSVPRSPGGTPIRQLPVPSQHNDPTAILAAVLKKRYAAIQEEENEENRDSESSFSDSDNVDSCQTEHEQDNSSSNWRHELAMKQNRSVQWN